MGMYVIVLAVAYFEALFQHSLEETEANYEPLVD
jgi:hypothetical protein